MYDKQTGSLWLQETGDALEGEFSSLKLSELPKDQYDPGVRWDEWLAKHPKSKILHCDHCMPGAKKTSTHDDTISSSGVTSGKTTTKRKHEKATKEGT